MRVDALRFVLRHVSRNPSHHTKSDDEGATQLHRARDADAVTKTDRWTEIFRGKEKKRKKEKKIKRKEKYQAKQERLAVIRFNLPWSSIF